MAAHRDCGHPPWQRDQCREQVLWGKEVKLPVIHSLAWLPSGSPWANFKGSVLLQVAEALQPGLKPSLGLLYL